ncbi:MAG: aminotransferase class V-fold PLP-dependent enzyme, partial [Thermoleophilia bacterium]
MSTYLDHASGWPLSAGVREAMARWIDEPGSPMALHDHARGPAQVVDDAHAAVAALVGWPAESVILTSGATEARNLAMKGTLAARSTAAPVIAADRLAHASTLAAARSLTRHVGALRLADVDAVGDVLPRAIADAASGADLVVVTHGQAEVGCVRDATALVAAARVAAPDAVIVLDAEETAGLLPVTDGHG